MRHRADPGCARGVDLRGVRPNLLLCVGAGAQIFGTECSSARAFRYVALACWSAESGCDRVRCRHFVEGTHGRRYDGSH